MCFVSNTNDGQTTSYEVYCSICLSRDQISLGTMLIPLSDKRTNRSLVFRKARAAICSTKQLIVLCENSSAAYPNREPSTGVASVVAMFVFPWSYVRLLQLDHLTRRHLVSTLKNSPKKEAQKEKSNQKIGTNCSILRIFNGLAVQREFNWLSIPHLSLIINLMLNFVKSSMRRKRYSML